MIPRLTRLTGILAAFFVFAGLASAASAKPSDNDPRIETWGADWPDYVEMYLETRDPATSARYPPSTPPDLS